MGLFSSMNVAATGLTAERVRLDVIADNIANATTTRTTFLTQEIGQGVRVSRVEKDYKDPPRLVYDPTHPDAIQSGPRKGYVEFPNVNIVNEMVDMISASRAYEANVAVMNGSRSMFLRALEIGR
jgi:flagellar basal-body rod protein FlgC